MSHPLYEQPRAVLPTAHVLLQANPGPMTLDGTNTWLLRAPGADDVIVVDPGQGDDTHLDRLLETVPAVSLVLLTHGHFDHSQTAADLHARTGAPVRAVDPAHCLGAGPLDDGAWLDAAGLRVRVLTTPGHTSDSASFVVTDADGAVSAVLTGDTILGRGTTVVAHPDGNLRDYLDSLHRLGALGGVPVLPGHGPELPSAADAAAFYLAHREQRLDQIRAALRDLGPDASARRIVEVVYADVDQSVWWAAELSVRAQLDYLDRS
ncbi:MAG: MBL fold metallo-hydrolase [Jatrophihabitans sp.]|uniref:MBL fold metallo-hydrolase n=1 Tax=Jatrophihabitans sp. TaxID=1932789 RepID=UPI003F7E5146